MNSVQMAPLTVEDYRLLPETGPRYQLIEGDLFMAPAPDRFHQDIAKSPVTPDNFLRSVLLVGIHSAIRCLSRRH